MADVVFDATANGHVAANNAVRERPPEDRDTSRLLTVVDDVLPDPLSYRAWALAQPSGLALAQDPARLGERIQAVLPGARMCMSFFRKSSAEHFEFGFIHSDADEGLGKWTAVLYLNPEPHAEDGTHFWVYLP